MKNYYRYILILTGILISYDQTIAQSKKADSLLMRFVSPPNSAKPRVWWHWMNGNITKDGIGKDLAWMKRAGIGGFQNFDAALGTPQIVKQRLAYMTPEWKDAFHYTVKLADSLHLEMAIASSPGWSESGGPWVPPQDGMKKFVWSETRVEGGKLFSGIIAQPPATIGPFQNLPLPPSFFGSGPKVAPYYKDIAVIAYKLPEDDVPLSLLNPKINSSGGNFSLGQLTDGDLATTNLLPPDTVHGFTWIQYEFEKPATIKALTIAGGGDKNPYSLPGTDTKNRSLEVSDDGVNFKRICYIPASTIPQQTIRIPITTARYFRITFRNQPPHGTNIAEIVLHTSSRISLFEEKAGFTTAIDAGNDPLSPSDDVTLNSDVIDLSGKIDADGKLNWMPPAGTWNIVRFGYSLLGITNHPASAEATGLEVDKLDPVAVKAYFEKYLEKYADASEGLMGSKSFKYMVTDSWEAGPQNWTNNMLSEFKKRRGYDMLPWMPVLTGHIINSKEQSEQFLWDFRKTLGELLTEYNYDQLTTILQQHGMKRYSESHESGRQIIADGMEIKRKAAIPMSAFWAKMPGSNSIGYQADVRESASVAHIYGQNLVAAESFTAAGIFGNAWSYSPETLKPTADMELASGLNRFVIHTSVHQPTDDKIPGLGLGPFGQWFTRHETWAEQAHAWTAYLSRSAYLLQQGKFVADIIYYYGEDNNITSLFQSKLPDIPEGYSYDFVNADALLNVLSVKNGKIVTPSGMQYKLLALDSNSRKMTLKVLKKINELVTAGAIIVGPKPTGSPGLNDDKTEYSRIVNQLWGDGEVTTAGLGKVITGTVASAVNELKIEPDFQYNKFRPTSKLYFVHRKLEKGDIYWVNNHTDSVEDIKGNFRVFGLVPEIWHPETGKTEPASYSFVNGKTVIPLHLEANDAVFVVFRKSTNIASRNINQPEKKQLATIGGGWHLTFQKDRGAPVGITMDKLNSWTENTDNGVKYFSGTATYSKQITSTADWFKHGATLWMDLGDVKNIAEVYVNGKPLGTMWRKPFLADMTNKLKPGKNLLEIKVTNLWVNRLIGDQQKGILKTYTYTTTPFYAEKSPLLSSGLLGPIQIYSLIYKK